MSDTAPPFVRKRVLIPSPLGGEPKELWIIDTSLPGVAEEIERQCRLVAEADDRDEGLLDLLDAAAADAMGWT